MNEIEKCSLCGKVPGWHDFDIEARIFGGERSYFCCGMKASTAVLWNQYASAMELAKLTVQMKTYRAYCPEIAFLHAQDRVLGVFRGNNL